MFLKSKLSEVIRAEAETCFLEIMKINILMLLLFVMIINNLVLTKVAIIQNIMLAFLLINLLQLIFNKLKLSSG